MSYLKSFPQSSKIKRFTLILFVLMVMALLAMAHFVSWPQFLIIAQNARNEGQISAELQLMMSIDDQMKSVYRQHALSLMNADTAIRNGVPVDSILPLLNSLPGVINSYFLDLEKGEIISGQRDLSQSDLIRKLDKRTAKQTGGAAAMTRRLVGGAVKFRRVNDGEKDTPAMVRYIGTYYPSQANSVIGLILDELWFTSQIPSRLDSLTRQSSGMLFYAPVQPDTAFNATKDIYASPGGIWKMTAGVLRGGEEAWEKGGDTLWWFGEREHPVVQWHLGKAVFSGYWMGLDEFDLTIGVRIELLEYQRDLDQMVKGVLYGFVGSEILAGFLILFLYISIRQVRRQSRRNQIALGHLAHSVKTPVSRLQLAADILEGGQVSSPDEERKIIQTVSSECRQLRRAVENAALSMEGGKISIHKETGDLAMLVKETTDAWRQSFDQAGVRLAVEGVEKPLQFSFDRDKIRLALDNLIDNALRHTYLNIKNLTVGSAAVTVVLRSDARNIDLSVCDSGAGIPKADMKNVFKRFGRSGKDPLTGVSGLGLGLALVKEIAEGHGGNVNAESAEGSGAKFVIRMTND